MKTTSRQEFCKFFCCDCFEDLLAPITFTKNFGFRAGIVFKIFAIESALQTKNQFLRNAFGKSYLLRHHSITIVLKNLVLEIGYTYYANSVFSLRSAFYNFFLKANSLKPYCANFFSGKLKFSRASRHLISLPKGQVVKKVNFDLCIRVGKLIASIGTKR